MSSTPTSRSPAPAANNNSVMCGLRLMIRGGAANAPAPKARSRLRMQVRRINMMGIDYNAAAQKMGRQLLFQDLKQLSADSILGLMTKYRADPSPSKVDLGVGVYRDLTGNTPVLDCVRRAEQEVLAAQSTKS